MSDMNSPDFQKAEATSRKKRVRTTSSRPLAESSSKMLLVQRVYQKIMEELDTGELTPGSRIIALDLAQRMGLSRAPVREALAFLAGQGLVELLPDRGAVLRTLEPDDLAEIYEITAPVAAVGLRHAALRIGEGDNAEKVRLAQAAVEQAQQAPVLDVGFYLALNEYHYIINSIAKKPYINLVLAALNIEYWNRILTKHINLKVHATKYVSNYRRMTDSVLAGDADAAEAIMIYHARWSANLLTGKAQ